MAESAKCDGEIGCFYSSANTLLEGDETYACLLTVPGIGPRTAAQLAVSVDIGRFPDHDHLASYCGIAPRVRSSGTSVRSVRASRRGDARLKSLLIFSCNSLVRSSGRYGEYYRACRARGMGHGRALKAVARKRLRAIYAVMRDRVLPGVAPTVDKTIGTPNDYLGPRQRRCFGNASERAQSEQIGMKRGRIDLLVMPSSLNDKLSLWRPRSVDWSAFVRTAELRAASSRYAVW